ncbi:MAG: hypothetical protein ACRDJC_00640 [Thermomicrobiales bacterium]
MSDSQREADQAVDDASDATRPGSDSQATAANAPTSLREDEPVRPGSGFDPTPYIRQLRGRGGGADYLDVKWRLLWLRKEHPDAEIVTELVQHDPQMAIFKATVTVPTGGKATGYGSETASDFPDFIEKAETKAIGRALNALGYGAQFGDAQRSEDPTLERGGERANRPVAAPSRPVALPQRAERAEKRSEVRSERGGVQAPAEAPSPADTDPELVDYSWSAFWPWARERGLNGPKEIENLIGQQVAGLSPAELRDLIQAADARR